MEVKTSSSEFIKFKLETLFHKQFLSLEDKFNKDISTLESLKYDYYNCANELSSIIRENSIKKERTNSISNEKPKVLFKVEKENRQEKESRERSKSPKNSVTTMTTSPNRDTEKIDQKNLKSEVKSDESKMNGLEHKLLAKKRNPSITKEDKKKLMNTVIKKKNTILPKNKLNATTFIKNNDTPCKDILSNDKNSNVKQPQALVNNIERRQTNVNKPNNKFGKSLNKTMTEKQMKIISENENKGVNKLDESLRKIPTPIKKNEFESKTPTKVTEIKEKTIAESSRNDKKGENLKNVLLPEKVYKSFTTIMNDTNKEITSQSNENSQTEKSRENLPINLKIEKIIIENEKENIEEDSKNKTLEKNNTIEKIEKTDTKNNIEKKKETNEITKNNSIIIKSNGLFENISFPDKKAKFLSIFCSSRFLNSKLRFYLIVNNKNINQNVKNNLLQKEIQHLEILNFSLQKKLNSYLEDNKIKELVNKQFITSKTSLNGLNYLTKEEESNILKTDQKQEINNVIKLIYLYIGEDLPQNNSNLIENLLGNVCAKYEVTSLKMLLLNIVTKKSVKLDQYKTIKDFIEKYPSCLNYLILIRLNKPIAYSTFILKEFYEYLQLKSEDGCLILSIKEIKSEYEENLSKLNKLKLLIC